MTNLQEIIDSSLNLQRIPLHESGRWSLQRRFDRKFLVDISRVGDLAPVFEKGYSIVTVDSKTAGTYNTVYFDTDDYALYHAHHRGRANRLKFRTREYTADGKFFSEIKFKNNKGMTDKIRFERKTSCFEFDPLFQQFSRDSNRLPPGDLKAQLRISFTRMTLIHASGHQRITIDTDLAYTGDSGALSFPHAAIIEIKSPHAGGGDPLQKGLLGLGVRPVRISKYCIGMAMTRNDITRNLFMPTLRRLEKLQ